MELHECLIGIPVIKGMNTHGHIIGFSTNSFAETIVVVQWASENQNPPQDFIVNAIHPANIERMMK